MAKIIKAGNYIVKANDSVLSVNDDVEFNDNKLIVVAGVSQMVTPVFSFSNSDRMIVSSPQFIGVGNNLPFQVNVGDSVYFIPESGNWDNLIGLDFSADNFVFDIAVLNGKINSLKVLNLFQNAAYGDISILSSSFDLENLNLSKTSIYGDIIALAGLLKLSIIDIGSSLIGGSISAITLLIELTRLNLNNTNVYDSISALANLTKLTSLRLYNTSIDGNISFLATLIELKELFIYYTDITGDIGGINTLTKLTSFRAGNSGVGGDVIGINTLINLVTLHINDTLTNGLTTDISATLINLTSLYIYRSGIIGDIASLYYISILWAHETNTTYSTGSMQQTSLLWYSTTPIMPVSSLNQLLADFVSVGNSNIVVSIGGLNPSITDAQALTNIATIQSLGGTVIYNT